MFLLKRKGISCKFLFSEYCILLFRADRNLHFSNSFCKRSFKNGLGRAGQKDLIFRPVPCNEKPAAAQAENLEAYRVAVVTESPRMVMHWRGQTVADLSRAFLDTNGAVKHASIRVEAGKK